MTRPRRGLVECRICGLLTNDPGSASADSCDDARPHDFNPRMTDPDSKVIPEGEEEQRACYLCGRDIIAPEGAFEPTCRDCGGGCKVVAESPAERCGGGGLRDVPSAGKLLSASPCPGCPDCSPSSDSLAGVCPTCEGTRDHPEIIAYDSDHGEARDYCNDGFHPPDPPSVFGPDRNEQVPDLHIKAAEVAPVPPLPREGESREADRWNVWGCPRCHRVYNAPGGCGCCEAHPRAGHPRPRLEQVKLVPASTLSALEQERDTARAERDEALARVSELQGHDG